MKFLAFYFVLTVFVSTACSFSIVGKVLNKFNQVQDVKKEIKAAMGGTKFDGNGLKNVSHGFVPSQIKCEFHQSLVLCFIV